MRRDTRDCAPNRSGLGPSCQMPPRALFGASRQSVASKQRAPICFIPTRARAPPNPPRTHAPANETTKGTLIRAATPSVVRVSDPVKDRHTVSRDRRSGQTAVKQTTGNRQQAQKQTHVTPTGLSKSTVGMSCRDVAHSTRARSVGAFDRYESGSVAPGGRYGRVVFPPYGDIRLGELY